MWDTCSSGGCWGEQCCGSSMVGAVWGSPKPQLLAFWLLPVQDMHREEWAVTPYPISGQAQLIPWTDWLLQSYSCCVCVIIKL